MFEEGILKPLLLLVIVVAFVFLCIKMEDDFTKRKEGEKEIITNNIPIASITVKSETNITADGFFLGIGKIEGKSSEKQYYVAYQILEDGGKQILKMDIEKTIIYDTLEDKNAYAEIDKNGNGKLIAIRLYVPKGTVTQNFDLSIE